MIYQHAHSQFSFTKNTLEYRKSFFRKPIVLVLAVVLTMAVANAMAVVMVVAVLVAVANTMAPDLALLMDTAMALTVALAMAEGTFKHSMAILWIMSTRFLPSSFK